MSLKTNSIKSKKHIIIVGDFGVGKSSILYRFIKKEFSKDFSNSSLDFCSYEMKHKDQTLNVFIWDSLGHDRFKSMTDNFYKKADGAIVVFDMTEEAYKDTVHKWMRTLTESCTKDIPILIVGNKRDISFAYEKKVNEISSAFRNSVSVINVTSSSAKNGDNIQELFHKIIIATFESSNEKSMLLSSTESKCNTDEPQCCCNFL